LNDKLRNCKIVRYLEVADYETLKLR
jgi:hypothetical protein